MNDHLHPDAVGTSAIPRAGSSAGPRSLRRGSPWMGHVRLTLAALCFIVGFWLAFPAHTNYLVVETDDIGHLHNFLLPGAGRTVCEITPVSDKPMPKPD